MVSVDRNTLISQIVSLNPQLKPDELHELSDAQLQAKLSQCIAGNKQDKNVDSVRINNSSSEASKTPKMTTEEAQDNAIENIESNAEQAQKLLDAQDDGDISKAYNFVKEKLNSELAKSNVAKVVHKQFETAEFLREAKQGSLTYKEYIKRKRGFLFNSIPNINNYNDKQRALIKNMIEALSPNKLDTMQTKVLNLPDSSSKEYTQASRKILYDLQDLTTKHVVNNNTLNLVSNKIKGTETKDHTKSSINNIKVTIAPPFIMEEAEAERLMTFEETYLLEQGVEFNKENIQKFNDSTAQYTFANSLTNKRNEIHSLLTSALEKAKVQGSTGLSSVDLINAELIPSVGASITKLYGKDNLAKGLKDLTNGQYSLNDEIKSLEDLSRKDVSAMNNIAKLILTKIDENYSKALNGKKLEDYAIAMAEDYKKAFGTKDASALASSFAQDQEGIVQTARNTVQIAGMVVMVGGMAFCPPAALGGGLISSFGGIGVEAYNENTKENPDEKKNKELGQEVLVNAALFAIGAGSGKVGSMAKTALTAKNAPKLVAAMVASGVDSSLSLLGDLTLTGQIDLSGEGFSQLMSLVAGHKGKLVKGVQKGKQFLKEKLSAQANTNNKILQMPDGTVVEVRPDGSTVEVKNDGEGTKAVKPEPKTENIKTETTDKTDNIKFTENKNSNFSINSKKQNDFPVQTTTLNTNNILDYDEILKNYHKKKANNVLKYKDENRTVKYLDNWQEEYGIADNNGVFSNAINKLKKAGGEIDQYLKLILPNGNETTIKKARELLIKYLENNLDIYSIDRLKGILNNFSTKIKELGPNKILYIPDADKSYSLISSLYLKEHPDIKTIIGHHNLVDYTKNNPNMNIVILDDCICSGESAVKLYNSITDNCQNISSVNMFVCTAYKNGLNEINNKASNLNLHYNGDPRLGLEDSDFYKNLKIDKFDVQQKFLKTILRYDDSPKEYRLGSAIMFPYMAPNNNAVFSAKIIEGLFTGPNVAIKNNEKTIKASSGKLIWPPDWLVKKIESLDIKL